MFELGKRFQFVVNKVENNTLQLSSIFPSPSFNNSNDANDGISASDSLLFNNLYDNNCFNGSNSINGTAPYDPSGAAKYIVVVVLVYGFGIIFFIASQVRSSAKMSDEVDGVNAEKILRSMETEIFTKEVLEKLSNKELREKAWKIYLTDDISKLVDSSRDVANSTNGLNSIESTNSSAAASDSLDEGHGSKVNTDTTQVINETGNKSKKPSGNYLTVQHTKPKLSGEAKLKKILDNENTEVEHIEKKLRMLNEMQSAYKRPHGDSEVFETVQDVLISSGNEKFGIVKSAKKAPPTVKCLPNQLSSGSNKSASKNAASKNKSLIKAPKLILQTDMDGLQQLNETQRPSKIQSSTESLSGNSQGEESRAMIKGKRRLSSKSKLRKSKSGTQDKDHEYVSFDVCETVAEQITTV